MQSYPSNLKACAVESLMRAHVDDLAHYVIGREEKDITACDLFRAIALCLRKPLLEGYWATAERRRKAGGKRVAYLSMEFLVGRLLRSTLSNLELLDACRAMVASRGMRFEDVLEAEPDPALGNGGLGRLAACFLESLATLDMPAIGYGINYRYGLFRQSISKGSQVEMPDRWQDGSSPWLVEQAQESFFVPVYGEVVAGPGRGYNPMWMNWRLMIAMPYDLPIAGYGGETVNVLRVFETRSSDEFDMEIFNSGDYIRAVRQKIETETITQVLYPSDAVPEGKELRLLQEYFLVACAVRDLSRRFDTTGLAVDRFPDWIAVQLNDTHPALAVAELMRMLVDEREVGWERAWEMTQAVCGYTNHTLLPEALEQWPVPMVETVLPRHMQIIYEINHRFLQTVRVQWPGDIERVKRMSLINEEGERKIRMAHLAIVGSHAVNGVSALHSRLVRERLFGDFHEMYPDRFQNKTNGVTHRRWLLEANPLLGACISRMIGTGWIVNAQELEKLERHAEQEESLRWLQGAKRAAKEALAAYTKKELGLAVDPAALFDVQVKRIHLYKRQFLNLLAIIDEYLRIVDEGWTPAAPRVCYFAGKAAPGYRMAKLVIRAIHAVGKVVNADARASDWLKVAFLPDYRVSLAEKMIPAADVSEQISTAGYEASGTGNMKLAMNGALTVGTLDGANIEIMQAVGAENIFIFGLTAEEVAELHGRYEPWNMARRSAAVGRVVEALRADRFPGDEPGQFGPLIESILSPGDPHVHLADLDSYLAARAQAAFEYRDKLKWARKSMLNVARMGWFSSDRTVREYAQDIWKVKPVNGEGEAD
jgi:starch phosphorylase